MIYIFSYASFFLVLHILLVFSASSTSPSVCVLESSLCTYTYIYVLSFHTERQESFKTCSMDRHDEQVMDGGWMDG
jgi:hypothetical protein